MVGGKKGMHEASPVWVGQLDVAVPTADLGPWGPDATGREYRSGRILAKFQGEPLGIMTVHSVDGHIDPQQVRAAAATRYADRIADIAGIAEGRWSPSCPKMPALSGQLREIRAGDPPPVSVVIGTKDRPDHVVTCVSLVLDQDYPAAIEVIVVDNGATTNATKLAVAQHFGDDARVQYLSEARPGLSRARNMGLAAAAHPVTAFLSDDIQVERQWLLSVARGLTRHPDVQCVTGFCPPLYLETPEQLGFESSMAWGTRQGFKPVLHRFQSADDPVHPYRAGVFANGSNMAYRTENFRRLGGFDGSLGPGTKARGGEDLDAPVRVLAGGGLVAFEPAMIGWHADRYDDRPFSKHMYTYGLGLTAFLAKHLLDPELRPAVIRRIPRGLPLLLKAFVEPDETLSGDLSIPFRYQLWQLAGRVAGPVAYMAQKRQSKDEDDR